MSISQRDKLISYALRHCCLSDAEMEDLGIRDDLFYDFMRLKRDMRREASFYSARIISLGENCMPHYMPVKWGIQPTLSGGGGARMPFDLAVSPTASVLSVLKENFRNFTADQVVEGPIGPIYGCSSPVFHFNHDMMLSTREKAAQIASFNRILNERVINFRTAVQRENTLFLLHINSRTTPANLIEELRVITRKVYDRPLLVLDEGDILDPCDTVYRYKLPWKKYCWFMFADWFTDAGFDFEFRIVRWLMNFIRDHFKTMPEERRLESNTRLWAGAANLAIAEGNIDRAKKLLEKAGV